MGTKKEIKEEITRILEENFNFILNTQDSILNLENTLSTSKLKISMYHIRTFMNNKGYIHNKATNEWLPINNNEQNASNNEEVNVKETILKTKEAEVIENKPNINNSITDDLKNFLNENSKNKNNTNSSKTSSFLNEETDANTHKNTTKNIREGSFIPEENIMKEIWKITDNTASNCEVILNNLLSLSKQVSENTLLLSSFNNSNEINNNDYAEIPSNQIMAIKCSDSKRYELTLPIAFVDAIKQKFFLKHPDVNSIEKLKDCKILDMILWDYYTSK